MKEDDCSVLSTPPAFNGLFTARSRELFTRHRRDLGVSYQQLGALFRVSWSTVRKWECGITRTCQSHHIRHIQRFLAGGYDEQLSCHSPIYEFAAGRFCNQHSLEGCCERIVNFYQLSAHIPELQDRMFQLLSEAVNEAASALVMTKS